MVIGRNIKVSKNYRFHESNGTDFILEETVATERVVVPFLKYFTRTEERVLEYGTRLMVMEDEIKTHHRRNPDVSAFSYICPHHKEVFKTIDNFFPYQTEGCRCYFCLVNEK